jgi:hypothetical protein
MSEFPQRPKGTDEHTWYRQIEKEMALAVISSDPEPHRCPVCGEKRLIFQCRVFASRQIEARCKECAIQRAGGPEKIWVRTDEYLRRRWTRNALLPAPSLPLHRLSTRSRARKASSDTSVQKGL